MRALLVALALIVVALVSAPRWLPRLLDRVYYRGPVSDHFDGARFFDPHPGPRRATNPPRFSLGLLLKVATGRGRTPWPQVPVTPTRPPTRVEGQAMRVTWIGHATVLVQTQGLNILTDPVWSTRASPVSFAGPKRVRAPGVRFEDLPKIDLVLLSHNHYDHLDVPTLKRLWARDRPLIVTGLGNDTILKGHGIDAIARDWGQPYAVRPGIAVIPERVHHWSSRFGADRNRALWSGFTVTLPGGNLFFAGDTGPGDMDAPGGGWPAEAARHGPFRLALIPIGAYHPRDVFGDHHIDPDQAVRIFETLHADYALAIHWGTFQLTGEGLGDPPIALAAAETAHGVPPVRFRATEVGEGWEVAAIGERR